MKELFKELKERWIAESPKFWKNILNISIFLGTGAIAMLAAQSQYNLIEYGVPKIVFTIAGYVVTFCSATGLTSKITKQE